MQAKTSPGSTVTLTESGILLEHSGTAMSKIFISHSHHDKEIAGEIKSGVERFGATAFVAHEDIRPTREWQDEIIENLKQCDVCLAILTSNFEKSEWTDQETGIAIGLGKTIIGIQIEIPPYGFVGKFQGLKWDTKQSVESMKSLLKLLVERKALDEDNIIDAFVKSRSFRIADYNTELLNEIPRFSKQQINTVVSTAVTNNQIWDATGASLILDNLFSKYSESIDPELMKQWKKIRKKA